MTATWPAGVRHRRVRVADEVELDVVDAGVPGDPVVVLLHGFPETSWSWRHQLVPLADAGWHVIAPDQRGYGSSSRPADVRDYAVDHLAADVAALLDAVGAERGVVVGHDWGALLAWHMGLLRPERCRAIVAASVPFNRWPAPPTEVFRRLHGDRFFYVNHFQRPGLAEAELDADPERFLRALIWVADGESGVATLSSSLPAEGTGAIEAFEHALGGRRDDLPSWLTEADLDAWVTPFRASGFFGPVNWYRNFDVAYELTREIGNEVFTMPTAFVSGAVDPVIAGRPELIGAMDAQLPNHLGSHLIPDVGHWVQQAAPTAFTEWLLDTLAHA